MQNKFIDNRNDITKEDKEKIDAKIKILNDIKKESSPIKFSFSCIYEELDQIMK